MLYVTLQQDYKICKMHTGKGTELYFTLVLLLAVFPFLFQNKLDLQYFRKKDLCSSMCLLSLNDDHYLIFIPELYHDIFTAFEMFVTLSYSYTIF